MSDYEPRIFSRDDYETARAVQSNLDVSSSIFSLDQHYLVLESELELFSVWLSNHDFVMPERIFQIGPSLQSRIDDYEANKSDKNDCEEHGDVCVYEVQK